MTEVQHEQNQILLSLARNGKCELAAELKTPTQDLLQVNILCQEKCHRPEYSSKL